MTSRDHDAPRVSVAMPFRNCEKTLALTIRSMLAQTFEDFELLLCDDNSTDGSLAVAASFADPRIVLWSDGQHKHLPARLNECIARARGQYMVRMDGDDIAYPERLKKQVIFLDGNPDIDLVSTFALVFGGDGEPIGKLSGPTTHEGITEQPLMGFRMWHPTWAGRMEWFRKHLYRAEAILAQDQELLFRSHLTSRFATLPEILLGYRQEELRFSKMIRYRRFWWRYMGWHLHGMRGFFQKIQVGAILSVKVFLDCLAVWSGLKYRLLRRRARPLAADEIAAWREVWERLSIPAGVASDYASAKVR